jgi:hypothetical protein
VIGYVRIAVSIVRGVRSLITLIILVMLMDTELTVRYALTTIPFGVRVVRKLTRITTLVMRLLILVSIGVRIVATIVLIGAIIATIILEMSVIIVIAVG